MLAKREQPASVLSLPTPCGAERLKPGHLCSKSPYPLSHLLPKPMVFFKYLVSSYVHVGLCASGTYRCTWRPECVRSAGAGTTSSCKPPDMVAENRTQSPTRAISILNYWAFLNTNSLHKPKCMFFSFCKEKTKYKDKGDVREIMLCYGTIIKILLIFFFTINTLRSPIKSLVNPELIITTASHWYPRKCF